MNIKTYVRSYQYEVRFAEQPPNDGFSGRAIVTDPWIPGRLLGMNAFGAQNPPIQAIPERLLLEVGDPRGAGARVRFLAKSIHDGLPVTAKMEADGDPLVVEGAGPVDENGYYPFEVRWKSGARPSERTYNVVISPADSATVSHTVPILVRAREE